MTVRGARSALLIAMLGAALAACTAQPEATPPESTSSPTGSPLATAVTSGDARLSDMVSQAQARGIDELPDVQVVREITPEELAEVQANCMAEEGFPPDQDGMFNAPPGQGDALFLALYRCTAMYPIAEEYTQPLSQEQIRIIYDYYVSDLVPCLRGEGLTVPDPPTWETFIATAGTEREYHPYSTLLGAMSSEALSALQDTCPERPSLDALYGNEP